MPFIDDLNRLLRDHEGYSGDGQGGVGGLPVGDRSTARRAVSKRDLRDLFRTLAQTMGDPDALQDILDQVEEKADLTSPTFTGEPRAPSPGLAYTHDMQIATAGTAMALARIHRTVAVGGHVAGVYTLTAEQARMPVIAFTGSLSQDVVVEIPTGQALSYILRNATLRTITVRQAGQAGGIVIPSRGIIPVISNGVEIFRAGDQTPEIEAVGLQVAAVSDRVADVADRISQDGSVIIGRPVAPAAGQSAPGGTYVFMEPSAATGHVSQVRVWCRAAGPLMLATYDRAGSAIARVRTHTVTLAVGLNVIALTAADLPIVAGQHLAFSVAAGRIDFTASTPGDSGGHYLATNQDLVTGTIGAVTTTARLAFGVTIEGAILLDVGAELDALQQAVGGQEHPLSSDGRTLRRFRAKRAHLAQTSTGQPTVLMLGDSWSEHGRIPQALRDALVEQSGAYSAYGWIDAISGFPISGISYSRAGAWSTYSSATGGALPDFGAGPDGRVIWTTAADATALITVTCETFTIYHRDDTGTFRYRVDGGAWTTVTGTNTGARRSINLGPLTHGSHVFEIDTVGNTGRVVFYGYRAASSQPGPVLHKMGSGGSTGTSILKHIDALSPYLPDLAPDLAVIILGTNDYRTASATLANYTSAITGMVARLRAAVPDIGIILWAPADTSGTAVWPLTDYVDEMLRLASELDVEFFNHNALFGTHAEENALGQWLDALHLSPTGARNAVRSLVYKLLY